MTKMPTPLHGADYPTAPPPPLAGQTQSMMITSAYNLYCNPYGKRQLAANFAPGPYDVICARGKAPHDSEGNQRFRALVKLHQEGYAAATCKVEKSKIVTHIVNTVRTASPQGGFVKRIDGVWYEVGDRAAKEKVGQTFRDLLHTKYSSSTKAKARARIQKRMDDYANEEDGDDDDRRAASPVPGGIPGNNNHNNSTGAVAPEVRPARPLSSSLTKKTSKAMRGLFQTPFTIWVKDDKHKHNSGNNNSRDSDKYAQGPPPPPSLATPHNPQFETQAASIPVAMNMNTNMNSNMNMNMNTNNMALNNNNNATAAATVAAAYGNSPTNHNSAGGMNTNNNIPTTPSFNPRIRAGQPGSGTGGGGGNNNFMPNESQQLRPLTEAELLDTLRSSIQTIDTSAQINDSQLMDTFRTSLEASLDPNKPVMKEKELWNSIRSSMKSSLSRLSGLSGLMSLDAIFDNKMSHGDRQYVFEFDDGYVSDSDKNSDGNDKDLVLDFDLDDTVERDILQGLGDMSVTM